MPDPDLPIGGLARDLGPGRDARGAGLLPDSAVCTEIVENARTATGARWVHLTVLDPETGRLHQAAWSNLERGALRQTLEAGPSIFPDFDPGRWTCPVAANPLLERIYVVGQAVAAPLADLAAGVVDGRLMGLAAVAGLRHVYASPVGAMGRIAGAVIFHFSRPLSARRRRICEAFVRQAALTVENGGLLHALRQEARELQRSRALITAAEERLRRDIAEHLHGRVQMRLIVVWHHLQECSRCLASDPAEAAVILAQVCADLQEIQDQEVRQASRRLHPAAIRLGLVAAVGTLLEEFGRHLTISAEIDPALVGLDAVRRDWIAEGPCLALYRALEEALGNVVRHAGAARVRVVLGLVPGGQRVRGLVGDDGPGFDPATLRSGLGLAGIAGRIDQVGGNWALTGAPGAGATLLVEVPVTSPPPILPLPVHDQGAAPAMRAGVVARG